MTEETEVILIIKVRKLMIYEIDCYHVQASQSDVQGVNKKMAPSWTNSPPFRPFSQAILKMHDKASQK